VSPDRKSRRPLVAAGSRADGKRAERAFEFASRGRREKWSEMIFRCDLFCANREAPECESIKSIYRNPLRLYAEGSKEWAEYVNTFAGTLPTSTGFSGMGHTGFPGDAIEHVKNPCLLGCATA